MRQNSLNTPSYRPPPAQVAPPVLPPPPANLNKLNSLGSQINPTAMIFLDSLGMKEDVKRWFHRDSEGHVLWFTVPPQDSVRPAQEGAAVTHSLTYAAWKKRKLMQSSASDVVMTDS